MARFTSIYLEVVSTLLGVFTREGLEAGDFIEGVDGVTGAVTVATIGADAAALELFSVCKGRSFPVKGRIKVAGA